MIFNRMFLLRLMRLLMVQISEVLMAFNKLKILIITSESIASQVAQSIGFLSTAVQSNLGIFFQDLHFNQHIKLLAYMHVSSTKHIPKLKSFVSRTELNTHLFTLPLSHVLRSSVVPSRYILVPYISCL